MLVLDLEVLYLMSNAHYSVTSDCQIALQGQIKLCSTLKQ